MEDESTNITTIPSYKEKDEFFSCFFPEFFQLTNHTKLHPLQDDIIKFTPQNLYYKAEGILTNDEIDNKSLKSLDEDQFPIITPCYKSFIGKLPIENKLENSFHKDININNHNTKLNKLSLLNTERMASPLHNQILFNPKKVKVSSKEQTVNQELNSVKRTSVNDSKASVSKINEKELKLLKNRISAKKCRQKKKYYVQQLEEQLKRYKEQISNIKNNINKDNTIENILSLLEEKEKEIELATNKKKVELNTSIYVNNQKFVINNLFIKQINNMMPIDCKVFQNKFIKLAQIENDDNIEIILNKINNNIKMLNELYEFDQRINSRNASSNCLKGKEIVAYKLFLFYEKMKKYTEIFLANLKLL